MWVASYGMALLKMTPTGSTSTTLPAESSVNPAGSFIHELAATTDDAAADPGDHDRDAGPEVWPWLQPSPAVDVDRDEDRLGEEEETLEGERDSEGVAPLSHEVGPEQAELEGQHRAR